jgi:hypothetical protein
MPPRAGEGPAGSGKIHTGDPGDGYSASWACVPCTSSFLTYLLTSALTYYTPYIFICLPAWCYATHIALTCTCACLFAYPSVFLFTHLLAYHSCTLSVALTEAQGPVAAYLTTLSEAAAEAGGGAGGP